MPHPTGCLDLDYKSDRTTSGDHQYTEGGIYWGSDAGNMDQVSPKRKELVYKLISRTSSKKWPHSYVPLQRI